MGGIRGAVRALGAAHMALVVAASAAATLTPSCGPPPPRESPALFGEIVGTVDDANGVAASSCRVVVEGMPISAACEPDGTFHVRRVVAGARHIVVIRERPTIAFSRRVPVGVTRDGITSVGTIGLLPQGSIGGRLALATPGSAVDFSTAIVAVRDLPFVVAPNAAGAFLLPGVPAGARTVDAFGPMVGSGTARVDVPGRLVAGVRVTLGGSGTGRVHGTLRVVDGAAPEQLAARVLARPQLAGTMAATMAAPAVGNAAGGAFDLDLAPGLYWLDVSADGFVAGQLPLVSVLPGERSEVGDVTLWTTGADGDLDGDGVANGADPDIDGDGVANAMDALPFNPWEHADADRDGIGDLWDPDRAGTGRPTTAPDYADCDMDGWIEATGEDNCRCVANRDQADRDGDGVGDGCDNCPEAANPDQQDGDGNRVGDACQTGSACRSSADCAMGQLCDGGRCAQCITSAHCPQTVCTAGACGPCGPTAACPAGLQCAAGRCVQCLDDAGCPTNSVCQLGACRPRCAMNADCPAGQMCRGGRCASCGSTADCPAGAYCDPYGACRTQCSSDADCVPVREACDASSRRCMPTCEAAASCAARERCDAMRVCRAACDMDSDCPTGLRCDVAMRFCVPQCSANPDCSMAGSMECRAGSCVPSGACTTDLDCADTAQRCLAGRCVARTGMDATGFTCAAACDCRMGELCGPAPAGGGARHCVQDPLGAPAVFVAPAGAAANTGRAINSPKGTLQAGVDAAMAGELVAVATGRYTAAFAISSRSRLTVVGGYEACGPTRWVRDSAARSRIELPTYPGIVIDGSPTAPAAAITVAGLELRSRTASIVLFNASDTDGLRLEDNAFVVDDSAAGGIHAVRVMRDPGARIARNAVSQAPADVHYGGGAAFDLVQVGGTVADNTVGVFRGTNGFTAIGVADNPTPLAIERNTVEPGVGSTFTSVRVRDCRAALTVRDNPRLGLPAYPSGGPVLHALDVEDCPVFSATGNRFEGGDNARFASMTGTNIDVVRLHNISTMGTFSNNVIRTYTTAPSAYLTFRGVHVSGGSLVTMDRDDVDLGILGALPATSGMRPTPNVIAAFSESTALVRITGGRYTPGTQLDRTAAAIVVSGTGRMEVLGVRGIDAGTGTALASFPADLVGVACLGDARLVLDRSEVRGGASSSSQGGLVAHCTGGVTVTNSVIVGGAGDGPSFGAHCEGGPCTFVASAIHGGGTRSSPHVTGLALQATSGEHRVTSCIVSSGVAAAERATVTGVSAVPANFANNYLYADLLPLAAHDGTAQITAGGMNINGGAASCYDPAMLPTRALAAGSRCVDGGPATLSVAGAPLSVDIDGRARPMGRACDIGPFELR